MKKTILTLLLVILSANSSFSQDYFIVDNDTTYCKNLKYSTTAQGYLKKMSYKKSDGKLVEYKKRKECPNVTTFYTKGNTIDRIPLKASKPDSYVRFLPRSVDGKIKTYSNDSYRATTSTKYTPGGAFGDWKQGGSKMGSYHYTIKMPDGKFYDIKKKKNMKKHIIPYLLKCEAFKKQYKGNFKTQEMLFNKTIELYNSLCQ